MQVEEEPVSAPPTDAPENGIDAGKRLMEYSEALARYTEETGETIFAQGESFRKECQTLAAGYRDSGKIIADRAVQFTVNMREVAKGLEELVKKFNGAS